MVRLLAYLDLFFLDQEVHLLTLVIMVIRVIQMQAVQMKVHVILTKKH